MSHQEFCSERRPNIGIFRVWLYRLHSEMIAPSSAVARLPIEVTPAARPCPSPDAVITVSGLEVRVPIGTNVGYVAGFVAEHRSRY